MVITGVHADICSHTDEDPGRTLVPPDSVSPHSCHHRVSCLPLESPQGKSTACLSLSESEFGSTFARRDILVVGGGHMFPISVFVLSYYMKSRHIKSSLQTLL